MPAQRKPSQNNWVPVIRSLDIRLKNLEETLRGGRASMGFRAACSWQPGAGYLDYLIQTGGQGFGGGQPSAVIIAIAPSPLMMVPLPTSPLNAAASLLPHSALSQFQ